MLRPIEATHRTPNVSGFRRDRRNVLIGDSLAAYMPTLYKSVRMLEALASKISARTLFEGLSIERVRNAKDNSVGVILRFVVHDSRGADQIADATRLFGGRVFACANRILLRYRDREAPYGYDLINGEAEPKAPKSPEFYALDLDGDTRWIEQERLELRRVLLSTQAVKRDQKNDDMHRDVAILFHEGLATHVLSFLNRRKIDSSLGYARRKDMHASPGQKTGAGVDNFSLANSKGLYLWGECKELPDRYARILHETPGIQIFQKHGEHAAVAYGYTHPLPLASFSTVLSKGSGGENPSRHISLWTGERTQEHVLELQLENTYDTKSLVSLHVSSQEQKKRELDAEVLNTTSNKELGGNIPPMGFSNLPTLPIDVRVVKSVEPHAIPTLSLIPLDKFKMFAELLYVVPRVLLEAYRSGLSEDSICLWSQFDIRSFPLGRHYYDIGESIYLPTGTTLAPITLLKDRLREHFQLEKRDAVLFDEETQRWKCFSLDDLGLLSRASVVARSEALDELLWEPQSTPQANSPGELEFASMSRFSLWRGPKTIPRKAIAGPAGTSTLDSDSNISDDR